MKNLILFTLFSCGVFIGCNDACDDTNCANGGVCLEGDCACPAGYSGDECETEDRAIFLGNYTVSGDCIGYEGNLSITRNATKGTRVYIKYLFGEQIDLVGEYSNGQITIERQSWKAIEVDGYCTINGDDLILSVTQYENGQELTCLFSGSKQ
jgi:hypothetical protein